MVHTVEMILKEDGSYLISASGAGIPDQIYGPLSRADVFPHLLMLGIAAPQAFALLEHCDKYKAAVLTRMSEQSGSSDYWIQ
jgi:hypothetical protein